MSETQTPTPTHGPCTIALAAEGRSEPCPEERCPYWEKGCILEGVDSELVAYPEVSGVLLQLRRELEHAREADAGHGLEHFHRRLAAGRE